jgi:methionine synthase I (cobalamin-dependent)
MINRISDWLQESSRIFWGEIAPCDKQLSDYDNDTTFFDALENYVIEGIEKGETVILIATKNHLKNIQRSLKNKRYNIISLIESEQIYLIDVSATIKHFVINGWPNDILFVEHMGKLVARIGHHKRVRVIGEMVAFMWENCNSGATLHLENLCRQFSKAENFQLVCAYPNSGFTQNATESIKFICKTHSRLLNDFENPYLYSA